MASPSGRPSTSTTAWWPPTTGNSRTNVRLGSVSAPSAPTIAEFGGVAPSAVAAANLQAVYQWDAINITLTGGTSVTGSGLGLVNLQAPTITDSTPVTVSLASTLAIGGAPTAGGSVTLLSPFAFWVQDGVTQLDGALVVNATLGGSTNQALVVGHGHEPNRDSASFFLGGGSGSHLHAGDYLHLFLSSVALDPASGTFGNLYSMTIDQLVYTGSAVSFSGGAEAATLFVKGKPDLSAVSGFNTPVGYAAHFGDGAVRIDGDSTFGYVRGPRVFELPSNTNHAPAIGLPTMVVEVFITGVGEKYLYLYDS